MRAVVPPLLVALLALGLAACGGEAPPPTAPTPSNPTADAAEPPPAAATLDTATLRQRAAEALGANRLYAPAGDNAVEDYLALREREPGDGTVTTALSDLAPYVIIGAEQAIAADAFPEAGRLIELLERMDGEAPAVPRLRDALASAEADAEARATAAEAEAERLAAEAERRAAEAPRPSASPAPSSPAVAAAPTSTPTPRPASTPAPSRPTPPATVAAAPTPATATTAPRPASPAARTLINRVSPRFPEAANRRRLEGEVEVSLRIAADGSVEAVEVVRADPPGVFDREAVLAVRRWRYAPAAAASEARVVLQFKRP